MEEARIRVNLIRQRKKARKKKSIKPRNLFRGLPSLLSRIRDNDELFQIFKEPHKYTEGLHDKLRDGAIRELSKRAASLKDESMLHTVAAYTQAKRAGLRIVEKIDPEDGLALAFIAEKCKHPDVGVAAVNKMPPVRKQLKNVIVITSHDEVAGAAAKRLWEIEQGGDDQEAMSLIAARSTDGALRIRAAGMIYDDRFLGDLLRMTKYDDVKSAVLEKAAARVGSITDPDLLTHIAINAEDAGLGINALKRRYGEKTGIFKDLEAISKTAVNEEVRKRAGEMHTTHRKETFGR